jgi:aldehyde:ferredoxin oxidoreductase
VTPGHDGCGDGHTGRRLRIDLTTGETRTETLTPAHCRTYVGGGLEATRLLLAETKPGYDPLSAPAPLCFMSTAVTGHPAIGLARVIVVAKSPMTGGIGECRVEGPYGHALKATGWDAVIITGRAAHPCYLLIDAGGAHILPAKDIWGTDTGSATDTLEFRHGSDVHCAVIGPAGERGVRYASIETDRTFAAARMGLGAVMGAKNLKGVVLSPDTAPPPADEAGLAVLTSAYASRIADNDLTRSQQQVPGFGAWPTEGSSLAGYGQGPNYSTSRIVDLGNLTAQALTERIEVSEGGCPGCPGDCIKTFRNAIDNRAGGLHQEAVAAFALNLGLTDPDLVMDLNASCHLWGVDPVSLSFTVSMLCEARQHHLLDGVDLAGHDPVFGDSQALTALMADIATGVAAVSWLGEGVRAAVAHLPVEARHFAMHIKGLEMVSFEPRASAGQALAYAVSPVGPRYEIVEHDIDFDPVGGWRHGLEMMRTLGTLDWEPMETLDDARVARTTMLLDMWSGMDALGVSLFAGPPVRELDLPDLARLIHLVTGWRTSDRELFVWGRRRWHLMRLFNLREGITAEQDTLPDRFFTDPIDDGRHRGIAINREAFDDAVALYYRLVGWDSNGIPTPTALIEVGLGTHLAGV